MQPGVPRMRIGQIGVWGFGGYRRQKIRESGLFDLIAVCDRNPEATAAAAREENARACANFDELLATPGLEGVVISTGADSHAELMIKALDAGLHVFCEKPLCATTEQTLEILAAERRSGKKAVIGFAHPEDNRVRRTVQRLAANGELGTLAAYQSDSSHSGGLQIKPGEWRGQRGRNPGGNLFQCGVHSLYLLQDLFGPVVGVSALMRYDVNKKTQTADVTSLLLRHESGMVGTMNCYHVTAYFHELRVFGDVANAYIDTHLCQGTLQKNLKGPVEPRVPLTLDAPACADLTGNLRSWFRAVREGEAPSPSVVDAARVMAIVFAADRSSEERREVSPDEVLPVSTGVKTTPTITVEPKLRPLAAKDH